MREITLDTETTGLDPLTGHRIVEIGCVELFNKIKTGKSFHRYLNPEREMPEEARRIHGLSDDFLKDKPIFASVVDDFLEFIGDAPLVIHNADFDMKFLNAELVRLGFPVLPRTRATDTVTIARKKFPGSPANLDALCRRFSIDLSARTFHGALLDAELLAEVYLELNGGRQGAMSLDTSIVIEVAALEYEQTEIIPSREFPISEGEIAAHLEFLKKIKNPLWLKTEEPA